LDDSRKTHQQIKDFFDSGNEQKEEHSFEESICRPLIGKQIQKPSFLLLQVRF